jgi:putative ABC transport system ATP-binding protein
LGAEFAAACTGVVKIYWTASGEVHALKGIDALFPRAAVTAVVGPSGSGKSSLLRILAGLDRATAGSVVVGGTELAGLPWGTLRKLRRRLSGYVFQRPSDNLIPYLTVAEHLELAARIRRVGPSEDILDLLGLGHRRSHLPVQLAAGEQHRLAFAQAVVGTPDLVVADEPTAELDAEASTSLLEVVGALAREGFSAFVVATHDPDVVEAADATLHLRHGALEAESREQRTLSVIDAAGRIQLPPTALPMFPDRRAVVSIDDGEIRITHP